MKSGHEVVACASPLLFLGAVRGSGPYLGVPPPLGWGAGQGEAGRDSRQVIRSSLGWEGAIYRNVRSLWVECMYSLAFGY